MLLLSVLLGLGSAVAYGCATAVQHAAVHSPTGESDAQGLLALLRNPRWWLSIGGDGVGLLLQVAALATGPVVLIQPLQVLSLVVALPIRTRLGGPPPTARDWWAVVGVVAGLGAFLALVGDPGEAQRHTAAVSLTVAGAILAGGVVVALLALRAVPVVRAVLFGSVSGALFAVVAVLIDEISAVLDRDGARALTHGFGVALLAAIVLIGAVAMVVTQAGFQVGRLGASYPPTVVVDPVLAVVLGAVLLGERLPLDPAHLAGYLLALAVVAAATIVLANPRPADRSEDLSPA